MLHKAFRNYIFKKIISIHTINHFKTKTDRILYSLYGIRGLHGDVSMVCGSTMCVSTCQVDVVLQRTVLLLFFKPRNETKGKCMKESDIREKEKALPYRPKSSVILLQIEVVYNELYSRFTSIIFKTNCKGYHRDQKWNTC